VIFGLTAALGWGFSDFGAAVVGRRMGSRATLLVAQAAEVVTILIMVLVLRPAWTMTPGVAAGIVANGLFAAAAYAMLYRALELGPVALVSPVVAAYAVITIILAVTVLGESVPSIVLLGGLTTVAGVVLTTTDPRQLGGPSTRKKGGLPYAFGATGCFGFAAFLLGRYSQEVGWLPTLTVSRLATMACLWTAALVVRPRFQGAAATTVLAASVVGILDVLGASAFARGAELGYVSIVAAASAIFPLIPVVGGVVLLGERPALTQYVGVGVVIGGLLLLSLG
jgi:drug/metabolite transporter (DMT)-like permease